MQWSMIWRVHDAGNSGHLTVAGQSSQSTVHAQRMIGVQQELRARLKYQLLWLARIEKLLVCVGEALHGCWLTRQG